MSVPYVLRAPGKSARQWLALSCTCSDSNTDNGVRYKAIGIFLEMNEP